MSIDARGKQTDVTRTNKRMDGLLRLPFQFRQLLLHFSFKIPIWPVWRDVQEILHV